MSLVEPNMRGGRGRGGEGCAPQTPLLFQAVQTRGQTPLMLAAEKGHIKVLEALLAAGAEKARLGGLRTFPATAL